MISRYKLLPDFDSRARVGILGGSFNPAHEGHRYITIEAIKMLNLDYVIWLVSPHNPSKDKNILQPLEDRVRYAKKISNHKKIIITDIEKFFTTNYTANTIERIKKMHPFANFIWIMGADNMLHINKWHFSAKIFANVVKNLVFKWSLSSA